MLVLMSAIFAPSTAQTPTPNAQNLPDCARRPSVTSLPRVDLRFCLERVALEPEYGELAYSALAVDKDGALYISRPLYGQVLIARDTDGDALPDSPQILIQDLSLPNALAIDPATGALYIAGGQYVYRWQAGQLETIIRDLPYQTGIWTGGLVIHQARLYVGIGAPCDACAFSAQAGGMVLSYDLEGADRQIVAQGLRQPQALAVHDGMLWIGDIARFGADYQAGLDELNRLPLPASTVPHFGFPYCIGVNQRDSAITSDFDCMNAQAPFLRFATHSMPYGLLSYTGDAFPWMQGELIIALGGAPQRANPHGFHLLHANLQNPDRWQFASILPVDASITGVKPPLLTDGALTSIDSDYLNHRGAGFWPHQLLSIAQSPEGWLYLSVGGGKIYALRPR